MNQKYIERMLDELEIEQIEQVLDEFKKNHPHAKWFSEMCYFVILGKRMQQQMQEAAELIQKIRALEEK